MTKNFSFGTIENFDHHIEVSVPNYKHIHNLILSISSYFITDNSVVNDLGCSTGLMIDTLDKFHKNKSVTYNGIEREKNIINPIYFHDNKHIIVDDLSLMVLPTNSLSLSIFTLQFTPIYQRKKLIRKIYDSIKVGGAFLVTEKIYQNSGNMQEIFTFSYYDLKSKEFTSDEILQKQKDLRRIQFPMSKEKNEQMLKDVGFSISTFYQSLNFIGWLCIK